ncbi:MAG: SH3 domain-containing protein [Candidatus Acidiferrales bacterium]
MKLRLLLLALAFLTASNAGAGSVGFAVCGPYDAYVMLYKSTDQFEELGKLRCDEKVEVITRGLTYFQVLTKDGRIGWVHSTDISGAPATHAQPETPSGSAESSEPRMQVLLPLNNQNIMNLHGMRLTPDIIIAKIQSSPCDFDTSQAALQKLKQAGIADKVILAMMQAPSSSAPPKSELSKPAEIREVKIPDGTAVEVELTANISSETSQAGAIVPMTVVHDVIIDGLVVIERGAEARARVLTVKPAGSRGRPGEVSWSMQDVTAIDGERIPASFGSRQTGTNDAATFSGEAPASFDFHKGKPAIMAAGQHSQAVIHGGETVKISNGTSGNQASRQSPSSNARPRNGDAAAQTAAQAIGPSSNHD